MKLRVLAVPALVGALFLSVSGAEAGPKVMDGKKVKSLSFTVKPALQDNTKDLAGYEEMDCPATRCTKLPFVYKPAKGAKGGLLFSATWTNAANDMDLYVAEVVKGRYTRIGNCASSGPPSEKFYLAPNQLRSGKTYAMVLYYFRAVNETVRGKVEMGVPNSIKTTVPKQADNVAHLNCTL